MPAGSREAALTALFAGAYAALVVSLVQLSFALVQVRVADALIPLSIIFGWPAVIGVTIGCAIANIFTPMPTVVVEVTLGPLANFLASYAALKISNLRRGSKSVEFLACLAASLVVTVVVGTYLAIITSMPFWVWWVGVFVGSFISISIVGFTLVQLLRKYGLALHTAD